MVSIVRHRLHILLLTMVGMLVSFTAFSQEIQAIRPVEPYPAPELAFQDNEGAVMNLSAFKGKPIILSFWASWCAPCLIEMPMLDRLQEKLGDKITIVPVAIENQGPGQARLFFEKARIKHLPIYVDTAHRALSTYKIRALPTSLIINAEGKIIAGVEGAIAWDSEDTKAYLEKMLTQ